MSQLSSAAFEEDEFEGAELGNGFLDDQLSRVVAPTSSLTGKRRTRRKIRRHSSNTVNLAEAATSNMDSIAAPTPRIPLLLKKKGPIKLSIQHQPHEPSPFLIKLQALAQPIHQDEYQPRERTVHAWSAPSETSLSPSELVTEALDLHIPDVDPFIFHQQFTPGDADTAYAEAYGGWQKLRAPFVRWEVDRASARAKQTPASQQRSASSVPQVHAPHARVDPRDISFPEDFQTQWTPATQQERASLRWRWSMWTHRLGGWFSRDVQRIEDAVQAVKFAEVEVIEDVEEAWDVPVMVPRLDFVKVFGGLTGLLLIASLPAGAVSLSRSFRGSLEQSLQDSQAAVAEVSTLNNGSDSIADAPSVLAKASEQFRQAEDGLKSVNGLATLVIGALPQTGDAYKSGVALLEVGSDATKAGRLVSEGVHEALTAQVRYPVERLATLATYLNAALPLIHQASDRLNDVDTQALPVDQQSRVTTVRTAITQGSQALDDLSSTMQFARALLGEDREQTYLLVFQNQAELRPSGGFMGSVAEVHLDRGDLTQVVIPGGGPYDLRGQLKTRVEAPEPLHLVNTSWEFQDANWFPDFADSAQKMSWFWSQGGQSTLDGVIAVNASVLEPLLRFSGPIELPAYGKTFTADNIQLELQKSVELEYDKTQNQPKKIIGDLFPVLLDRIRQTPPEKSLELLTILNQALQKKDVQLWFRDTNRQEYAERFGWGGRIKPTTGDALGVIEANIGGQKTDAVIQENVHQDVQISTDGHIEATVTLDRVHNGQRGELFRGANNVEYVRLYVPQGSELLSVEGTQPPTSTAFKMDDPVAPSDEDLTRLIQPSAVSSTLPTSTSLGGADITQEAGRTVFGVWVQLMPGDHARATFRYRLPFTVQDISERALTQSGEATNVTNATNDSVRTDSRAAYTLYLTSQSGKSDRQTEMTISYPEDWSVRWTNRTDLMQSPGKVSWSGALDQDQVFALSFTQPGNDSTHAQISP